MKKNIFFSVICFMFISCGSTPNSSKAEAQNSNDRSNSQYAKGDLFIGKWMCTHYQDNNAISGYDTLVITKSGDQYLINGPQLVYSNFRKLKDGKIIANYKPSSDSKKWGELVSEGGEMEFYMQSETMFSIGTNQYEKI